MKRTRTDSMTTRLKSVLASSKAVIDWLLTGNQEKTTIHCNNPIQVQSHYDVCDKTKCSHDIIEIPEEFRVREFPGSSLFSLSRSDRTESGSSLLSRRRCHYQPYSGSGGGLGAESRDERFYHVFKKGEVEELIKSNVPKLRVTETSYHSGHWSYIITKTI